MNVPELSSAERRELHDALLHAFRDPASLRRMVDLRCGKQLDRFTDGTLENRAYQLILRAEEEGWTQALLDGARDERPGNPALGRFFERFAASGQRSVGAALGHLQRLVVPGQPHQDAQLFRDGFDARLRQVCRVERAEDAWPLGTGFLVSPSVIITCGHVVEGYAPAGLQARFGYRALGGATADAGVVLGAEALLASSPPSAAERRGDSADTTAEHELDFALLRLSGHSGDAVVGETPRGFVTRPDPPRAVGPGDVLMIVQHPQGEPVRLGIQTLVGANANGTRIRYRTSTGEGSSGSPCFDLTWGLVALHQGADPGRDAPNRGVPIERIRAALPQAVRLELGWS
jgi:hypothetical protein